MSTGDYYGRVDYTCLKPESKSLLNSLQEALVLLIGLLIGVFKKILHLGRA